MESSKLSEEKTVSVRKNGRGKPSQEPCDVSVVTETYSVEQVKRVSESMLELAKVMVSAYVMELGPLLPEVEGTGWSQEHK